MRNRVVTDPEIQHGKPVIRGTRVPVARIIGGLAGGMSIEQVRHEYQVTEADIRAALASQMGLRQNLWVLRRFTREKSSAGPRIPLREGTDDFGAHFRHARARGHPDRPIGSKPLWRNGFPLPRE